MCLCYLWGMAFLTNSFSTFFLIWNSRLLFMILSYPLFLSILLMEYGFFTKFLLHICLNLKFPPLSMRHWEPSQDFLKIIQNGRERHNSHGDIQVNWILNFLLLLYLFFTDSKRKQADCINLFGINACWYCFANLWNLQVWINIDLILKIVLV